MTAPLKPWERAGVNSRAFSGEVGNVAMSPTISGNGGSAGGPPPVPPRPDTVATQGAGTHSPYRSSTMFGQTSPYNSYGGYSSGFNSGYGGYSSSYGGSYGGYGGYGGSYGGYGGYGGSGFGNYGGFGSYGSFGSGGGFNSTANPENRFIAAAEESSQHAFQSLESIVRTFGSISMMLDSTLFAVFSSFRAVLGVADHFSRLRSHLGRVFSALAIFRTAKWAYHKLLYLLGLRKINPNSAAWSAAWKGLEQTGTLSEADIKKNRSSWPIAMFMSIIVSAPYLIWRIVSSLDQTPKVPDGRWAKGEGEHYVAVAEYDFNAGGERELSLTTGQRLRLAPRSLQPRLKGWLLAALDAQRTGLVPANYVRILSKEGQPTAE